MVRNTAREIAIHLSYELNFSGKTAEELLDQRLTAAAFAELAEEEDLYREVPNAKQAAYIRRLVRGVDEHGAELDGYIEKYAKGWKFSRIPLVASAIMRNRQKIRDAGDGEIHQRHSGQLLPPGALRIKNSRAGMGVNHVRLCFFPLQRSRVPGCAARQPRSGL